MYNITKITHTKKRYNLENLKKFIAHIREQSALLQTEEGLLKFREEDSEMMFEALANTPGDHKKERIREAIKEVFDLDSKDLVIFRQNGIFIKRWGGAPLIPPKLVEKIKEALLKEQAKSQQTTIINDSISIGTEKLFEELGICPGELSMESKEKIKQKLREQINLSNKDIVLFLNDKVIIRKFKEQIELGENIKRDQRFNGLPKEELEELKNTLFESAEAEAEIVAELTDNILASELDFASITHSYFIKNYIKIFQKNIFNFLRENLSDESIVIEGLANLILRENWILIHSKMALAILELVARKNANAEAFLKNYSGEIEVDNERNKFKLPEILDSNGDKWNVPSIIGIVMQRQKMLDAADSKRQAIANINKTIDDMYSKLDELNSETIQIEKELNAINYETKDRIVLETAINAEIKELREILKRCREEDKKKIQDEISDKTLYLKKLVIKEDSLFTRKKRLEHQSKLIASKIEKINFDIVKLQKRGKEEEEKIAQFLLSQQGLDEKFNSLCEALTMALMKRKTKL